MVCIISGGQATFLNLKVIQIISQGHSILVEHVPHHLKANQAKTQAVLECSTVGWLGPIVPYKQIFNDIVEKNYLMADLF